MPSSAKPKDDAPKVEEPETNADAAKDEGADNKEENGDEGKTAGGGEETKSASYR